MVIISVNVSCHVDSGICGDQFGFRDEASEIFCQDGLYVAAVYLYFCLYSGLAFVQPYVCMGMNWNCRYVGVEVLERYGSDCVLWE